MEYTRYKYVASTRSWAEEYKLNNSSFTAAQWAAISSGITALGVAQIESNRQAIIQINNALSSKMEFYRVTLEDDPTYKFIGPDGEPLTYADLKALYYDAKYFLYAEYQSLTYIPSFPPEYDPAYDSEALEFTTTYKYMGTVNYSRIIINEDNDIKAEFEVLATWDDLRNYRTAAAQDIIDNQIKQGQNQLEEDLAKLRPQDLTVELTDAQRLATLNGNQNSRLLNLSVIADVHAKPETSRYHWSNNVELWSRCSQFTDAAVLLGDVVYGGNTGDNDQPTRAMFAASAGLFTDKIAGIKRPLIIVHGNHDANVEANDDYKVTDAAWSATVGQSKSPTNYYYVDFDEHKIRLVVLNQWLDTNNAAIRESVVTYGGQQIKWVAEQAFNLSGKDDIANWAIIILQHGVGYTEINDCVAGLRSGKRMTGTTADGVQWVGDYAAWHSSNRIPIIAVIHGHEHRDTYYGSGTLNVIGVEKTFVNLDSSSENGEIGTVNEYCHSIFMVDTVNKVLTEKE